MSGFLVVGAQPAQAGGVSLEPGALILPKPFGADRLTRKVHEVLAQPSLPRPVQSLPSPVGSMGALSSVGETEEAPRTWARGSGQPPRPARQEGVRTATPPSLVGSPCPVSQERPLRRRQTVCSGSCRAKRWRARQVDQRRASVSRDEEIRALLETALKKLGGERS
jgi:hypothetical protein